MIPITQIMETIFAESAFQRIPAKQDHPVQAVIRKKENRPEAADHVKSKTRNQRWIDFLRSTISRSVSYRRVYACFAKGS